MPHVVVKMHPGRSEQQKAKLAEAITQQVMAIARVGADAVSVAIEEVNATEWAERVYRPDILGHPRTVVTRGIRVPPDVVALRLDIQEGPVRPLEEFRVAEPDLCEIGLFADTADPFLAKFKSGRSMRVYVERAIYIVKPNERRHWSSSNAQVDLRRVLDDLRSKRVKAITVENLVPITKQEAVLRLH